MDDILLDTTMEEEDDLTPAPAVIKKAVPKKKASKK